MNSSQEQQYIDLICEIINKGDDIEYRNGKVRTIFGNMMRFSLEDNTIPILTTKKTAHKTCLKELLWFISGNTSNDTLREQNVHIWDGNASREFLDSRGLNNNKEGDLGPVYGFQWRHFNASYDDSSSNYQGKGVDQLQKLIDILMDEKERYSRRLILTAWNPCQLDEMALPPCHILAQFHVSSNNELSCSLYQRSGDVGLGVPFNIASYSYLTHLIAHHCNLKPKEFVYFLGNAHIYEEHIESLKEQIQRECYTFPKLNITRKCDNIEDYTVDDFNVTDYKYHSKIFMEMKA